MCSTGWLFLCCPIRSNYFEAVSEEVMVNDVKHYPEEPDAQCFPPSVIFVSWNEPQEEIKLAHIMHISEKCFVVCKCEPCVICSCLLSLLSPVRTALHACICKCVFSLSLSVSLSACLLWPLQPFPSHPSLQSPCEIWSSNCPAWTPHSFHGPAYRHCVTLTTANYHCDGELSLTLALWEYRYISLNKSAQLHTHTHSRTAVGLLVLAHHYIWL